MLVNKNIIDSLCNDAGVSEAQKANEYREQKKVKIIDYTYQNALNFEVKAEVVDEEKYDTYIAIAKEEVQDITCTCEEYRNHYGVCRHTLATIMQFATDFEKTEQIEKIENKLSDTIQATSSYDKYRGFKQIVNIFYNEEIEGIEEEETELKEQGTIKLEPEIFYDKFKAF